MNFGKNIRRLVQARLMAISLLKNVPLPKRDAYPMSTGCLLIRHSHIRHSGELNAFQRTHSYVLRTLAISFERKPSALLSIYILNITDPSTNDQWLCLTPLSIFNKGPELCPEKGMFSYDLHVPQFDLLRSVEDGKKGDATVHKIEPMRECLAELAIRIINREVEDIARQCATCRKKDPARSYKKCSRCLTAYYCQPECQKADWLRHKPECTRIANEVKKSKDCKADDESSWACIKRLDEPKLESDFLEHLRQWV